ncbi:MAG TPA: hypothetical protein VG265_14480 [Gaiellaceae bacterium]|nr:hypothetical protein [Gaiellaceae bacterium]
MKSELLGVPIPDEAAAQERARQVVTRAFSERMPATEPLRMRRLRPALLAFGATAAAVVAIAVSPAGSAIVHSVRQAVGLRHAAPALTRLPAPGALLVTSTAGPWVVQPDGSKRLLGRYLQASWSPHGLFVAVTRRHELLAVDPKGTIHWSLARAGTVTLPRWSPDGYRIAYLDGNALRIVAGDGTDDRFFAPRAAHVAAAWRPSGANEHVLAFVTARNELELADADSGLTIARRRLTGRPSELLWSKDGRRLAVVTNHGVEVFDGDGGRLPSVRLRRPAGAASFVPGTHDLTVVLGGHRSDAVTVDLDHPGSAPTEVFSGSGRFGAMAWAPDGRWLLLAWPTADQWLFVPAGDERVVAVAGIAAQFEPGNGHARSPVLDGWCCGPDGGS